MSTLSSPELLDCFRPGNVSHCEDDIWRCLSAEQILAYDQFVTEYESIRASEGRGSFDPLYYRALPYKDLSGKLAEQWKMRARTFEYVRRHVIEPRGSGGSGLRILDLGAGNGWLSYRLALLGHHPVALDLLVNDTDGLGAARHFAPCLTEPFPRVQAVLEELPFRDGVFDVAIFNASFHYSQDYRRTLGEAVRCLRPGGIVVIADSPWYQCVDDGEKMVAEKRARFLATYGFQSCSVVSQEFLTPERLNYLGDALHLKWQTLAPFYGVGWTLRPLWAKLKRRRTPSRFLIYVAEIAA